MASTFITLRDVEYEVEYTYEYDPSVGVDGVYEWDFVRLTAAEVAALALTEAESDAIGQELTDIARDYSGPDDY